MREGTATAISVLDTNDVVCFIVVVVYVWYI